MWGLRKKAYIMEDIYSNPSNADQQLRILSKVDFFFLFFCKKKFWIKTLCKKWGLTDWDWWRSQLVKIFTGEVAWPEKNLRDNSLKSIMN